jgi:acyl-CoA thioesterase-2
MSQAVSDLLSLLTLEEKADHQFQGESEDLGFKTLFGGQLLGQAIKAAGMTVDNKFQAHSFHSYFLRPGRADEPVQYKVDNVRDGHRFAVRRVTASQNDRDIFTLTASFQIPEEGLEHQSPMPSTQGPEGITSHLEFSRLHKDFFPEKVRAIYTADKPIEMHPIDPINVFDPKKCEQIKYVWFRASAKLPNDQLVHQSVLSYASDFNLITTALHPHGV